MNNLQRAENVIVQRGQKKSFCTPLLLVIMGVVGAGKSTLARKLIDAFPFYYASADNVRAALCSNPNHCVIETKETYTTMYRVIQKLLEQHHSVLLDATLPQKKYRRELRNLFGSLATIILVHVTASRKILKQRILHRQENLSDPYNITFGLDRDVVERFNRELQPPHRSEADRFFTFQNNNREQFKKNYETLSSLLISYLI